LGKNDQLKIDQLKIPLTIRWQAGYRVLRNASYRRAAGIKEKRRSKMDHQRPGGYLRKGMVTLLLLIGMVLSLASVGICGSTITQVSTYDAILSGVDDGFVSLKKLLTYGNLGLGTFHAVDGELILLDGKIYQAKSDGKVYTPPLTLTTPFVMVAKFKKEITAKPDAGMDYPALEKILTNSGASQNLFWAIKMKGRFSKIKLRSPSVQKKPYPPLTEIVKTQSIFNHENIAGTFVGFRTPVYMKGIGAPGYHFHFISEDHKVGGHVLAFTLAEGTTAEIEVCNQFLLILPEHDKTFSQIDFSVDRSAEVRPTQR
jgi:acetolactate decarboxylase